MNLEKQQIARQFSRAAATYDEVADLQLMMASQLIDQMRPSTGNDWLVENLGDGEAEKTLVDFGCGTGSALAAIATRTSPARMNLIGVDIAPGMIKQAQQRFTNCSQVKLILGDLEQSGLADESANIAFSNAAIQWCDSRSALAEMQRVLLPGGQLLVSTFGPQTLVEWKNAWRSTGDPFSRVHRFDSLEQLQLNLSSTGFHSPQISSSIQKLEFTSIAAMFASIKRLGATNANQTRATGLLGRGKFRLFRDVFKQQLETEGVLRLSFECIFLCARKGVNSGLTGL